MAKGIGQKFVSALEKEFNGTQKEIDTVHVNLGWNLIGGIGYPVPVDSIVQDPSSITTSSFYGFNGSYVTTDTLQPGRAYWVKVNQSGMLVLRRTELGSH